MKPRSLIPLPTIERVALSNFDLYTRRPDVDVAVAKPVFCLIGANGLGKSTFLNTLNYAITGALPEPARRFQSAVDYFKNASRPDRREDYFRGRLSTAAAASATATVTLAFERMSVTVERAIGGGGEVVSLRTRAASLDDDQAAQAADMEELAEDLEGRYREIILRETGLKDFAQFVFVFHFLLTFDEGRHLLMWDDGALTNALYLAFGADPQQARGAETIRREMEREDSRARNARFAARNVTKRIEQLGDVLRRPEGVSTTTDEELRLEHERLLRDAEEATDRARRKRIEMQAAEAKRGSVSAALLEAQIQYRRQFAERLRGGSAIEHNPIVSGSINDDVCTICGTRHIAERLREKVASGDCPLCDSPVTRGRQDGDDETFESLRLLDVEIGALHDRLESLMLDHRTVSDQLASSERTEEAARARLSEFEEAKAPDLTALRASTGLAVLSDELARLEAEKQGFIEQSREHYAERDALRDRLRTYEKQLRARYESAAIDFVPRFRELAEEFIGIPIDVQLDELAGKTEAGFGLRLQMGDQLRLEAADVSESQRFFIDIALRMALTEFMTGGRGTLMVDTPEGSLDIAYEARAGAMFAKFTQGGGRILMTANLRSSELVIRLAEKETRTRMEIARMTEWTDLSEVQQGEEKLFDAAYDTIERALG